MILIFHCIIKLLHFYDYYGAVMYSGVFISCLRAPYAAHYEQIDPGDLSLTGLECLLCDASTLGTSAGQQASWLQCLTTATQQQQRGRWRESDAEPVFTLSLQQNW